MGNLTRTKALGNWGEKKIPELLKRAGFGSVRDFNSERANHPFADFYAERGDNYVIGAKTRNKRTAAGPLNSPYNVCKKGMDLSVIASMYSANLACVAVQVDAEAQSFSAFFATMDQITEGGARYSIPMTPQATGHYECLARDEYDPTIRPEWSNQTRRNR